MQQRIGLNALSLRPGGGGVTTYIRELIAALASSSTVPLVARVQEDVVSELPSRVEAARSHRADGIRRAVASHWPFPQSSLVHGLDVDLPFRSEAPLVTTIHDLAVFDVPWAMTWHRAFAERQLTRSALARADAVIAVSDFTAARIRDRLGREAIPIPLAASADYAPPDAARVAAVVRRYELPARFILHVGTLGPHKDTSLLVAACREIGVPAVLVGRTSGSYAKGLGIIALGYVPRDDLAPLYAAAEIVAYVSRYEGFGLPPLEAMACGAAVVTTNVASLSDVVGNGALLVRSGDLQGLVDTLRTLLEDTDMRIALRARARARAAGRTWDDVARETMAVYSSLGVTGN